MPSKIFPVFSVFAVRWLPATALFLTLLAWLDAFFTQRLNMPAQISTFHNQWHNTFNADAIHLDSLAANILHGGSMLDWVFPAAPHFFPDILIALLARLIGGDAYHAALLNGLIQTSLLLILLCGFLMRCAPAHPLRTPLFVLSMCAILLLLTFQNISPFHFLLLNNYRVGTLINGLGFLLLADPLWSGSGRLLGKTRLITLLALVFLATASDITFLVWFLVPFLLIGFTQHQPTKGRLFFWLPWGGLFFLAGLCGFTAKNLLFGNVTAAYFLPGTTEWQQMLEQTIALSRAVLASAPVYAMLWLLGVLALLWCARPGRQTSDDPRQPLARFFLLSALLSALAVIFSQIPLDTPYFGARYLHPLLLHPVLLLPIFLVPRDLPATATRMLHALLLGVALLLPTLALAAHRHQPWLSRYTPDLVECVDTNLAGRNLKNGLTGFWLAKPVQMLSRVNLRLSQYISPLIPYYWLTDKNGFRDTYDFVLLPHHVDFVMHQLNPNLILRLNGPPRDTIACPGAELWIYGKDRVRVQPTLKSGESFTWRADMLPWHIGLLTPSGARIADENLTPAGAINDGPFLELSPGTYRATLRYESPRPEILSGTWEIHRTHPHGSVEELFRADLPPTQGSISDIAQDFTVPPDAEKSPVRIRTLFTGHGGLWLESLTLERLK